MGFVIFLLAAFAAICLIIQWRVSRPSVSNELPPLVIPLTTNPSEAVPAWHLVPVEDLTPSAAGPERFAPPEPSPAAAPPAAAAPVRVSDYEIAQHVARAADAPPVPTDTIPTRSSAPSHSSDASPPHAASPAMGASPSAHAARADDRTQADDTAPYAAHASGAASASSANPAPHTPAPTPLKVVRDYADLHEPAPSETVRFRRPTDEPVQLLPGRLEVVAGDPRRQEIRFVRVPGRPAELILGRDPGDSAQHVTLRSNTVSRQHARFDYADGHWVVANLSQTNPVVLNDTELSVRDGSRVLADGDRLELGEVVLRFHAR